MCAADTGFHQLSRDDQMSLERKGTGVFVQNLARLTDDELREPSLLAEWSRAHLVAHVGYNAAALCNLMSVFASEGTVLVVIYTYLSEVKSGRICGEKSANCASVRDLRPLPTLSCDTKRVSSSSW